MAELLEFLLDVAFEVFCSIAELEVAWRFFLPVLGALAVIAVMAGCVSNSGAQMGISVPVLLVGIVTGIIWQLRGGRGRAR